jgi:hypothetical protein
MSLYDLTITRIREARHRISERLGHDPQKVVDYYLELQKKYRGRLLTREPEEVHEVDKAIQFELRAEVV